MESSPMTSMAPLLLRNFITSLFIFANKSLLSLAGKYKLLETVRYCLVASFLFFLRVLPSLNPNSSDTYNQSTDSRKESSAGFAAAGGGGGEGTGIARALSQLLSIATNLPVSSRKYEVVRGMAEEIVEANRREGVEVLLEVNRAVLSAAFERTLGRLEAAVAEQGGGDCAGPVQIRLNRVLRAVWNRVGGKCEEELSGSGCSGEKLAAELLWLSEKMVACGFGEEAVWRWASASNLAWLSLYGEARLQGSLVKISAFLFKQAKEMGQEECVEDKNHQQKQIRMKMLMSWLPLLCRASNGSDTPILTSGERAALEKVLKETIEKLEGKEQEQVLSLWLYHFTYNPSSDWPDLQASYTRWCNASRNLLLQH